MNPGARLDERGQEWFGDYRLHEMLGRGGMASVFKAERRDELVALKRPLASFLDDQPFLDRFLREAEIGRTLNHPNIVRILERGNVLGRALLHDGARARRDALRLHAPRRAPRSRASRPGSWSRSPRRSTWPTARASCTAT